MELYGRFMGVYYHKHNKRDQMETWLWNFMADLWEFIIINTTNETKWRHGDGTLWQIYGFIKRHFFVSLPKTDHVLKICTVAVLCLIVFFSYFFFFNLNYHSSI